jgi:hypothetical protein
VTLVSARELKNVNLITRMDVYAVVTISGDPLTRQCTAPDPSGGRNPRWDATLRFAVPPSAHRRGRGGVVPPRAAPRGARPRRPRRRRGCRPARGHPRRRARRGAPAAAGGVVPGPQGAPLGATRRAPRVVSPRTRRRAGGEQAAAAAGSRHGRGLPLPAGGCTAVVAAVPTPSRRLPTAAAAGASTTPRRQGQQARPGSSGTVAVAEEQREEQRAWSAGHYAGLRGPPHPDHPWRWRRSSSSDDDDVVVVVPHWIQRQQPTEAIRSLAHQTGGGASPSPWSW